MQVTWIQLKLRAGNTEVTAWLKNDEATIPTPLPNTCPRLPPFFPSQRPSSKAPSQSPTPPGNKNYSIYFHQDLSSRGGGVSDPSHLGPSRRPYNRTGVCIVVLHLPGLRSFEDHRVVQRPETKLGERTTRVCPPHLAQGSCVLIYIGHPLTGSVALSHTLSF